MTSALRGAGRARGESGKEGGEGFTPVSFEIGFGLWRVPCAALPERQHPSWAGGSSAQGWGVPGRSPVTKQFRLLWNLRCFQVQERRVKPFSIAAVLLTSRTRRDGFVRSPLLGVRPPRRGAGLRPLPRLQLRELARLLDALDGFVRY